MNYIDYLSEYNKKFEQLRLRQATFSKGNCLQVQLLFPDKANFLTVQDKQEILTLTQKYVSDKVNLDIKYTKSYIDKDVIWQQLENYFKLKYIFADNLITKNDIELVKVENNSFENKQNQEFDCYKLIINMPKSLEDFIKNDFIVEFTSYLHNNLCANFELSIKSCVEEKSLQNILKENDNRQTELEYLRDVGIQEEDKYYTYQLLDNLIGEIPENYAIRLDQISTMNQKNIIAGKLKFINEKKYPDKKDETKEKIMYSLTIEDYWGKMRCVYFPNQNTVDTIKKLQEGDELALMGDYDEYNGNSSFKINSIAYAKLEEKPEENINWRKPFEEYLVVKPEPYVELSQTSLLDNGNESISDYLLNNDVVVFDFETTGLNVEDCYIIELGAVKIHKGKLTETFSTLVKPPIAIPKEITELTHISNEMVENAPCYELVLADFYKFTRGCILSAYNIDFDVKFLQKYGRNILFNFDNEQIDTLLIARQNIKGLPNYKLKTVVNHLKIELISAHRALDDAIACAKVFQKLM